MQFPYIHISLNHDASFIVRGQRHASLGTSVKFSTGTGGIFANWNWREDELTAEVDPHGMFSLFYSVTADGVMLSPSPIQLISIRASAELDRTALAVFHLLGWYINEDTPFKHIKVLPPDGRLHWRNGKLTVTRRPRIKSGIKISLPSAIEEYERLFSAAIRSCWGAATEPVIIPLSGGRDSRHILLESVRQGFEPDHCVTYDPTFGDGPGAFDPEWECAKQITDRLGLRHEKIKTLQSKHAEQLRTIYLTHLGTDEHIHYLALTRHLAGRTCLDGIGGDTLSRNKNISTDETRAMTSEQRIDALIGHFDKVSRSTIHDRIKGTDIDDTDIATARRHLVECHASFSDQPDPHSHFMFWQRTRREIGLAPGAMLANARQVLCPYLDPALVEFCLALPDQVTADGTFHDRVIRHSYPEIAVPYHDQFNRVLPRPPLTAKLHAIMDAVASKATLGMTATLREPFDQARMLIDRRHKDLHFWRTYHQVIKAASISR
jgi:asparagine synthase (glutamine-hydrolysing)